MKRPVYFPKIRIDTVTQEIAHCLVRGDFSAVYAIKRLHHGPYDVDKLQGEVKKYAEWLFEGDELSVTDEYITGLISVFERN